MRRTGEQGEQQKKIKDKDVKTKITYQKSKCAGENGGIECGRGDFRL